MVKKEQVQQALAQVQDPELKRSLIDLGMVRDLTVEDGQVRFTLALTTLSCPFREGLAEQARAAVQAVEGVEAVEVDLREMTAEERRRLVPEEEEGTAARLNHVGHVLAVMSGKGGVGKSLVSALLAVALQRQGYRVGILDADITGPSIPHLFFAQTPRPEGTPLGIIPVESAGGIKVMSINLLLPREDEAVIWRGPMIGGAIKQFWGDVLWGDLDVLVVDLPPGTSDASLTVMQSLPLNGVVLVTSPQGLSAMVVRKAARMAQQMGVPLLGLVENMSYAVCPDSGRRLELFGPSHAGEIARETGVPLLGQLPIDPQIATMSDAGQIEKYEGEAFAPVVQELIETIGLREQAGLAGLTHRQ